MWLILTQCFIFICSLRDRLLLLSSKGSLIFPDFGDGDREIFKQGWWKNFFYWGMENLLRLSPFFKLVVFVFMPSAWNLIEMGLSINTAEAFTRLGLKWDMYFISGRLSLKSRHRKLKEHCWCPLDTAIIFLQEKYKNTERNTKVIIKNQKLTVRDTCGRRL